MIDRPKVPHVHAAVIKAWADGAEIEWRCGAFSAWFTSVNPGFIAKYEYRVKPEPHKHQDLIDALKTGATDIQFLEDQVWRTLSPKENWVFGKEAELRRAHKWQKEMDAFRAGEWVQWCYNDAAPVLSGRVWYDAHRDNPPTSRHGISDAAWDFNHLDFRIKPEQVISQGRAFVTVDGAIRLESPRTDSNLQLTFEGGKLIAAKVLS